MNQSENSDTSNVQYEIADPAVMTITPLVSVVMATYNHGSYIAEAIEGVIAQKTDFPIELIIGEDCSTDNTREIVLDYQRHYPHLIRVIYSDRNVGMRANGQRIRVACRGEFIALCEGDDYWIDPEKLAIQVKKMIEFKECDICFHSNMTRIDKLDKLYEPLSLPSHKDKVIPLSEIIATGSGGLTMTTASILVRKEVFQRLGRWFYEIAPVGDFFVKIYGAQRGGALYINRIMSVYRMGNNPHSWSTSMREVKNRIAHGTKLYKTICLIEHEFKDQQIYFTKLIYNHYKDQLYYATFWGHEELRLNAIEILESRYSCFNFYKRICLKMAKNKFLCLIMIRVHSAKNRVKSWF